MYGSTSSTDLGILTRNGGKRIYNFVQEANQGYLPFARVTEGFEWQGLMTVPALSEENRENVEGFSGLEQLTDDISEMVDLKGVTATRDTIVGRFKQKGGDHPGYMVVNCSLPSGQKSDMVTLDFGRHENAVIYKKSTDGKAPAGELVKTIGGKLRITIEAGDGIFVVPV